MKIAVRLVAYVGDAIPNIDESGEGNIELPEDATVADALAVLDVAAAEMYMTLVNETVIRPSVQGETVLSDGDELTVFPPIKGG